MREKIKFHTHADFAMSIIPLLPPDAFGCQRDFTMTAALISYFERLAFVLDVRIRVSHGGICGPFPNVFSDQLIEDGPSKTADAVMR